jgi:hypothetical protein
MFGLRIAEEIATHRPFLKPPSSSASTGNQTTHPHLAHRPSSLLVLDQASQVVARGHWYGYIRSVFVAE